MFNLKSHPENANHNHYNEIPLHRYGFNKKKRRMIISVDEDVENLKPSDIIDGNIKWYGCFGKQPGNYSTVSAYSHHRDP